MGKDDLGDRMKMYERLWSLNGPVDYLDSSLPICIRIDGRAFHTFAAGLERPYDPRLAGLMVGTLRCLVEETNARVGITQSDEISLVLLPEEGATPYFGAKVQKLVSVLASLATAYFNKHLAAALPEKADRMPMFDARVWNVPDEDEAANVILWRELDAYKNGVASLARCHFSHKELKDKGRADMIAMLAEKGVAMDQYPRHLSGGTFIVRRKVSRPFSTEEIDKLPPKHDARTNPNLMVERTDYVELDKLPPLIHLANRVGVLFHQEAPVLREAT
jgi:tRNA(His) 5'-end guanylyltransferase